MRKVVKATRMVTTRFVVEGDTEQECERVAKKEMKDELTGSDTQKDMFAFVDEDEKPGYNVYDKSGFQEMV